MNVTPIERVQIAPNLALRFLCVKQIGPTIYENFTQIIKIKIIIINSSVVPDEELKLKDVFL